MTPLPSGGGVTAVKMVFNEEGHMIEWAFEALRRYRLRQQTRRVKARMREVARLEALSRPQRAHSTLDRMVATAALLRAPQGRQRR